MVDLKDTEIMAARRRGEERLAGPRAVSARYIVERDRFEIDLTTGWSIQVPRSFSPRTASAAPQDCSSIEIIDDGLSLHWPTLDEDWFVPAVIEALAQRHAA